jgi:TonB family protein
VASNGEQVIPACVEVTAILPNERKVVAQIIIGSYRLGRLGLSAEARFHLAVVEDRGRFRSAQRLSVLPQLLSASPPKTGLKAITLPVIQATRPLRLHIAASPVSIPPPKMAPVGMELDPPPPRPSAGFRVSKGVSIGDAITRVTPTYPLVARQINAVGEVQVEIVIDETGRVIEAKAISGHTVLRFPAEEAAKRWVFKPTLLDGKPVKQRGLLTFVFTRQQ